MDIQDLLRGVILRFTSQVLPGQYWDIRAKEIDEKWGHGTEDYPVLQKVLQTVRPGTVLDIGCATGRLFPVYSQPYIKKIVGQDISHWALAQAKKRYKNSAISLTSTKISSLSYPSHYFDLCVSNRVLSAVRPTEIAATLKNIIRMSTHVYLNEFSASDGSQPSSYWFLHDYFALLKTLCDFTVLETGLIDKQTYHLIRIDSRHFTA